MPLSLTDHQSLQERSIMFTRIKKAIRAIRKWNKYRKEDELGRAIAKKDVSTIKCLIIKHCHHNDDPRLPVYDDPRLHDYDVLCMSDKRSITIAHALVQETRGQTRFYKSLSDIQFLEILQKKTLSHSSVLGIERGDSVAHVFAKWGRQPWKHQFQISDYQWGYMRKTIMQMTNEKGESVQDVIEGNFFDKPTQSEPAQSNAQKYNAFSIPVKDCLVRLINNQGEFCVLNPKKIVMIKSIDFVKCKVATTSTNSWKTSEIFLCSPREFWNSILNYSSMFLTCLNSLYRFAFLWMPIQ